MTPAMCVSLRVRANYDAGRRMRARNGVLPPGSGCIGSEGALTRPSCPSQRCASSRSAGCAGTWGPSASPPEGGGEKRAAHIEGMPWAQVARQCQHLLSAKPPAKRPPSLTNTPMGATRALARPGSPSNPTKRGCAHAASSSARSVGALGAAQRRPPPPCEHDARGFSRRRPSAGGAAQLRQRPLVASARERSRAQPLPSNPPEARARALAPRRPPRAQRRPAALLARDVHP